MGHIPEDAKWFLADIVMEIVVQGDSRNVVHVNTTLVRAYSPFEAYERAQELGVQGETSYENSDGKMVTHRFRGLRSLEVIYEPLEHGAELIYTESIAVPEEDIAGLVTSKERLGVFRPITPSQAPDYGSRDVIDAALRLFQEHRNDSK
jgi:hypothetical protein